VLAGVTTINPRLEDSLNALEKDKVMREALGSEFIKLFLAVKRHETNKAAHRDRELQYARVSQLRRWLGAAGVFRVPMSVDIFKLLSGKPLHTLMKPAILFSISCGRPIC
jgi:Glutamine synthetase, catalytic domain